jgi:hypothetical protein
VFLSGADAMSSDKSSGSSPADAFAGLSRLLSEDASRWMDRMSAWASAIMVAAAGLIQFGTSFSAAEVRWSVAGIVTILCLGALIVPLVKPTAGRPTGLLAMLLYAGIGTSAAVVLCDVVLLYLKHRRPADCFVSRVWQGEAYGGTPDYGRLRYFVDRADIVRQTSLGYPLSPEGLYSPETGFIDVKIVKRPHVSRASIDDLEVEVVHYVPLGIIPPPKWAPAPTSSPLTYDADIPFVVVPLRDLRAKPLPWSMSAQYAITNSDHVKATPWWQFDRQLRDDRDYARFHLYLAGESPGFYVFNVYVVVNDQRVLATPQPLTCLVCRFAVPGEIEAAERRIRQRHARPQILTPTGA